MGKDARDHQRDYTDPELRERLKKRIKASDRGGAAGKWSARKLSSEQARRSAEHERGHKARKTVLRVLDRRAEG